jgi:hypothetical protein
VVTSCEPLRDAIFQCIAVLGVYVYQREWARNWSEVKKTKA